MNVHLIGVTEPLSCTYTIMGLRLHVMQSKLLSHLFLASNLPPRTQYSGMR